jgi:hypothetical protein
MTPFQVANLLEAGLWTLIAIALAGFAIGQPGRRRRLCLIAAVTFLLFGVSDVVETQTGAWYRPWWLFCWKAICVAAMVILLVDYRRSRREKK